MKGAPFAPTPHLSLTRTSQNSRSAPLCTWCLHLFYLVYFSSWLHPCQFLIHGSHQETNLVLSFPLLMGLCLILSVSPAATGPLFFTLGKTFSRALCISSPTSHPVPFCLGITQVMDRPCRAIRLLEISPCCKIHGSFLQGSVLSHRLTLSLNSIISEPLTLSPAYAVI